MNMQLLQTPEDHKTLFFDLKNDHINPSSFAEPPDSYPAMACWAVREIDSMSYGWDADGDYVYPSAFDIPTPAED